MKQLVQHTPPSNIEKFDITLIKTYPDQYDLDAQSVRKFGFPRAISPRVFNLDLAKPYNLLKSLVSEYHSELGSVAIPALPTDDLSSVKARFAQFREQIEPNLQNVPDDSRTEIVAYLDEIDGICGDMSSSKSVSDRFLEEFLQCVPGFVLFSSFDDVFPNVIPLSELDNNPWIRDLGLISDLDIETIKSGSDRAKIRHKTQLNVQINRDFSNFWEQDLSKIVIEWDNEKLYFWIEENEQYYEPEIRSKGRQWYLAFYIRVTARAREDYWNVILIDEPGLYLHARAQRDVLKKLSEVGEEVQVLFATHSPYLLEADKLERIRLVQKDNENGTKIENKIHKVADKETLTPILTAIGLEMSDGIAHVDRVENVVVEGPSDYYYFNALKQVVKEENINFVYGGGAGNMPMVGTILQGWGCRVIYLYDNDQAAKEAEKRIKSDWITTSREMIAKIPIERGAIEDVFSRRDYARRVIRDQKVQISGMNSQFAKKQKRDKVLDAKLFLESLHGKEFVPDAETKKNIQHLFDLLRKKFSPKK